MSGYLIDTGAALIALSDPRGLSPRVRKAMLGGPNILSVVSYWEVVIKTIERTLRVGDPGAWWRDALDQSAATPLPIWPEHVTEVCNLPPIHKDPFDRMLIAQATGEAVQLITTDREILRYASARLWVVS